VAAAEPSVHTTGKALVSRSLISAIATVGLLVGPLAKVVAARAARRALADLVAAVDVPDVPDVTQV
jgi:hypothetical protein